MNEEELQTAEETSVDIRPKRKKSTAEARRKKRRKWREMQLNVLALIIIVPLALLIALYLIVFPRSTVSAIENRNLNTFPSFSLSSYFSGDFTEGIADWYDDTVPFRDSMKRLATNITSLAGFSTDDTVTLVNVDFDLEGAASSDEKETEESSDAGTSEAEEEDEEEETGLSKDYSSEEAENEYGNGILVVKQDGHYRALPIFSYYDPSTYCDALNNLRAAVDDDVNIWSMPAPLASQFYIPSNAQEYYYDQSAYIDSTAEELDDGITTINICPVLEKHTAEAIYARTDHHWTALGAYYAAQAFTKAADLPFAKLDTMEEMVNHNYVGTMYSFTNNADLLNDPEDFIFYMPTSDYTTYYYTSDYTYDYTGRFFCAIEYHRDVDPTWSYTTFMGGDDLICRVKTDVDNGRVLLVVKDSYGNAEIPFYFSSFEEIIVTDLRYLQCNLVNMIEDFGVTDVLFTMSTGSVSGTNAELLQGLIDQNPDQHYDASYPADDESESETETETASEG